MLCYAINHQSSSFATCYLMQSLDSSIFSSSRLSRRTRRVCTSPHLSGSTLDKSRILDATSLLNFLLKTLPWKRQQRCWVPVSKLQRDLSSPYNHNEVLSTLLVVRGRKATKFCCLEFSSPTSDSAGGSESVDHTGFALLGDLGILSSSSCAFCSSRIRPLELQLREMHTKPFSSMVSSGRVSVYRRQRRWHRYIPGM